MVVIFFVADIILNEGATLYIGSHANVNVFSRYSLTSAQNHCF